MGVLGSYLFSALLIEVYRKSVRRDDTDVHAKRRKDKREKFLMVKMSKGFQAWGGILLILWILFVLRLVAQWCPTLCELWNVARQAPMFMRFSRREYWSGLPCPPLGDFLNPGIEPRSPTLQADSLPSEPPGKPSVFCLLLSYSSCIHLESYFCWMHI